MPEIMYALVDGENSGELSPGKEDGLDRSHESFGGEAYGDDNGNVPNAFLNSQNQNADCQRRRQGTFTAYDYQQMDFESSLNRQPHPQPFQKRISLCRNTCCDASKVFHLLVSMVLAFIAIFGIGGLVGFIVTWSNPPPGPAKLLDSCTATTYWKGWHSINYAFAL